MAPAQRLTEDINLAYEMKVRNKRFEAGFMQMTNPKAEEIRKDYFNSKRRCV